MGSMGKLGRSRGLVPFIAVALVAGTSAAAAQAGTAQHGASKTTVTTADPGCAISQPGSAIKHVIYLQFDNVHLTRDNPNVPSDLQQMPNLLNFLTNNGTVDSNHHTPLIAHTGNDILTSITGLFACSAAETETLPDAQSGQAPLPDPVAHPASDAAVLTLDGALKARGDALFAADRAANFDPILKAARVAQPRAAPPPPAGRRARRAPAARAGSSG